MSNRKKAKKATGVAEHRPALSPRRFKHDVLRAVDLFTGFGGLTDGIRRAGFETILAANHNRYKIEVHERNHPYAEHWIADLVNDDESNYHSARDLPAADLLVAGVSCTNHSQANTKKAYAQRMTLFDLDDPDFESRVTRSERDRATANCVLWYAEENHPRMVLVECTTELTSWGPAIPGKPKIGDGTTYRWWLREFKKLGYRHRVLYLNSMFFGVGQSRDRLYIVFWKAEVPAPDLDHRPIAWCGGCNQMVESVWTWRTGIPPTGSVRYAKQYDYRCPRCRGQVLPHATPSLAALDLSNLGTRIGDKPIKNFYNKDKELVWTGPMAEATMARAEKCRQRFADFPAVLMPDSGTHGVERLLSQPMATQTSRQETALLSTGAVFAAHRHNGDGKNFAESMDTVTSTHEKALLTTGAVMVAAGNTFERPGSECRTRGFDEPLWTQSATNTAAMVTPPLALAVDSYQGGPRGAGDPLPTQTGSETMGILSARILPNRTNGTSRSMAEPMETLVGNAGSGGIGMLSTGIVPFRRNTVPTVGAEPMPTVTAEQIPGLLTAAGMIQQNQGIDHRVYPVDDPLRTLVGAGHHASAMFSGWTEAPAMDEWRAALAELPLEDCYFRMLGAHEVGRGCGFDVDFPHYQGTFIVWGSARDQVDGFGNAVSPQVGHWIGDRLRAALHGEVSA